MNSLAEASEVYEQVKDGTQLDLIIYHIHEAIKRKQKSVTFTIGYNGLMPNIEALLKEKGYSWDFHKHNEHIHNRRNCSIVKNEITIYFVGKPGLVQNKPNFWEMIKKLILRLDKLNDKLEPYLDITITILEIAITTLLGICLIIAFFLVVYVVIFT